MRATVGWLRSNRDAYFETHEVEDKEFLENAGRVSNEDPIHDPDRDTTYYVREKGRPVCRVEPSYTIIVNDER
ncbi:MAG: hypothetical protein LZ169_00610 [Thaumarchaeota archaeon]|jgi:hypothetical protein|nr:hypothetical protein [Candidatus Wolframiiraptor allenii]